MKNSRTSQIAALVLLVISDIVCLLAKFGPTGFRYQALESPVICYLLLAIMIGAIIYYIAISKKKKVPIIISIIAVCTEILLTYWRFLLKYFVRYRKMPWSVRWASLRWSITTMDKIGFTFWHLSTGGLFLATTIILIALLVTFIKTKPVVQRKKEVSNTTPSAPKETPIAPVPVKEQEHRKRCNVCGYIFCYTDKDLARNKELLGQANQARTLALLEALGGTRFAANQNTDRADNMESKIIDYSKCPKCNSSDLVEISADELNELKAKQNSGENSTLSAADELKKFKELLDQGVITQAEFNAKKKQLLDL